MDTGSAGFTDLFAALAQVIATGSSISVTPPGL